MASLEVFNGHRPLLFSIAYQMLGSVMEAEDIVQETYLRWREAAGEQIRSPRAYLAAIATRLSIDRLRSAQLQRETYIGPWLPEPLVGDSAGSAADQLLAAESISMAFLVLMERLSPVERAVFLLREVFDYDYDEIADIVGKSQDNCRQLFSRARRRLATGQPRSESAPERQWQLLEQFMTTCVNGDMPGLLNLLAEDVTLTPDGGGKVVSARRPILTADKVARFLFGILKLAPPDLAVRPVWVNGWPGLVSYSEGRAVSIMALEVVDGRIRHIYAITNPDKLQGLGPG